LIAEQLSLTRKRLKLVEKRNRRMQALVKKQMDEFKQVRRRKGNTVMPESPLSALEETDSTQISSILL
jgi:hypothetical protein